MHEVLAIANVACEKRLLTSSNLMFSKNKIIRNFFGFNFFNVYSMRELNENNVVRFGSLEGEQIFTNYESILCSSFITHNDINFSVSRYTIYIIDPERFFTLDSKNLSSIPFISYANLPVPQNFFDKFK